MDLQYYKIFNEDTSQGIVGLLKPLKKGKNGRKIFTLCNGSFSTPSSTDYFFVQDEPSYPIFVFKISKEVNTLADHELKVSKDLENLTSCLPHFNRIFEIKRDIKCHIPDNCKKYKADFNPFEQYNCIRDVSIIEYIPSKLTLLKYVQEMNFSGCTESLIHQLILALFISQQEKKFTHYDLHLENVLLRRCFKRTFFLYKFSYEGVVLSRLIHTNGYFPVIFDYGFAYSQGLNDTNYNNTFFFTNKGYTSFTFDEINDYKILMIRLASLRSCPLKIKKMVDDYFLKTEKVQFKLDKETGWIKTTLLSASRVVSKKLKKILISNSPDNKNNFIYKEADNVIDLFGILLKLPLAQNDFNVETLNDTIDTFLKQWMKIDIWFTSSDDKLNILKKIFETINILILENSECTQNSGKFNQILSQTFKLKLFEIFDAFGEFVHVKNLDYGALLSSIIEISNFIEAIIYGEIERCKKLFNTSLNSWMLFNAIEEVVGRTEPYQFEKDDSIVVLDCIEKTTTSFELKDNDVIEALNLIPHIRLQIDLLNSLQLKNFTDCTDFVTDFITDE
jgi:hypothetical protein